MKLLAVWSGGRERGIFDMKDLLKFITCGSVDDGKSTLIGHMLYDAKLLFADQKRALELDSKVGSRDGKLDYSLLLDGLMAEREQGITIDVAYRYFTTGKRSFIVADTPGHEEYTRNMAVGASFADLSVILIDASQGVLAQTKRHTRICFLMGIRHFIFAVNKMDLIGYEKERFKGIETEIRHLISEFAFDSMAIIPVSATEGDNLTKKSFNTLWYQGDPLLSYLEHIEINTKVEAYDFILPVQRVSRPNHTFRGFQGQIEAGCLAKGDEITILPSKEKARVKTIYYGDREEANAAKGMPVTIQLDREVDVSRGCVLTCSQSLSIGSMFTATLLWMDDAKLVPGRNYDLKLGTKLIPATVMNIKYRIRVNDGSHIHTKELYKNELAVCDISTQEKIVFDTFEKNRALGSFILIDRIRNTTSCCGIVEHPLRRGSNVIWQSMDITKEIRAQQLDQTPFTLWFTGLSGSGKSTLANHLEKRLVTMGKHTMLLDGDNIRLGLNKDLGFEEKDRVENIRRIAEVAKLMNDAGMIVLTAFISPYEKDRANARQIIGENFIEVHVNTPLEVCEQRDVKGLYGKARKGEIPNFTGVSSPYESPEHAEIIAQAGQEPIEDVTEHILQVLTEQGLI